MAEYHSSRNCAYANRAEFSVMGLFEFKLTHYRIAKNWLVCLKTIQWQQH
jgi:hypothetical protein